MKVLHVITGLDVGGAELQLDAVLQHTRNDADVVTLYNPGPVADKLREHGVRVRDLGMRRNTELGALLRLYRIIRDGRYDVVHAHLYRAQVYARPAARLARTPVIVTTEHSIGETHIERRKMTTGVRALYLASELTSDATIAVAEVVRDRLVRWGVPARKITVIPNGLDFSSLGFNPAARSAVREQFGISPDAFVIGTLGRLDPNKRIDLAIEACARLRRKLVVIGSGQDESRLRQMARPETCFLGWRSDEEIRDHLRRCRALIFPGEEDFGIVPVESMACSTPVIALGKGGAAETVVPHRAGDDATGVWFDEQTPECLAEAILEFESHADDFDPSALRRQALRFSAATYRERLFAALDAVLEGRDPARGRLAA